MWTGTILMTATSRMCPSLCAALRFRAGSFPRYDAIEEACMEWCCAGVHGNVRFFRPVAQLARVTLSYADSRWQSSPAFRNFARAGCAIGVGGENAGRLTSLHWLSACGGGPGLVQSVYIYIGQYIGLYIAFKDKQQIYYRRFLAHLLRCH